MDSVYKKLDKVRKPRVQISYDVETGGASVKRELPFVVGVIGDYAGDSEHGKVPFKDRKFVNLDGDNFSQVMTKISPELHLKVENTLTEEDSEISVDLKFSEMEDFEPDRLAEQVPALKKLLDVRTQLKDLLSKADRSDELEGLLENILKSEEDLKNLSEQLSSSNEE